MLLLLWYNIRSKPCMCKALGFALCALSPPCGLDGLAKMPLQANVFTLWFNIIINTRRKFYEKDAYSYDLRINATHHDRLR